MFPSIPGYELLNELGRGGMGVVYKCRQLSTDTICALKLMLKGRGASREDLTRFRVEAEALACLDHPHITRILDVGVVSGSPYFVTEFATNGTIRDFATRENKSIDWCAEAIQKVSLAVHHAHTRWMIHRDLKPTNILIDEDESPKVTDFGLVKFTTRVGWVATASRAPVMDGSMSIFDEFLHQYSRELAFQYGVNQAAPCTVKEVRDACLKRTGLPLDAVDLTKIQNFLDETAAYQATDSIENQSYPNLDGLTQSGDILGSPHFMAPEQWNGQLDRVGPATDVYGLGATLYWLLTGEFVFPSNSITELLSKMQSATVFPIPVSELNPNVPEALNRVVWKAIQKDPVRRYPNCKLLAEELACYLSNGKPKAQRSHELRSNQKGSDRSPFWALFERVFPSRAARDHRTD